MSKIDMIERNLLERTCDVRWWALEKSFWECISIANNNSEQFAPILSLLQGVINENEDWDDHRNQELSQAILTLKTDFQSKPNTILNPSRLTLFKSSLQKITSHLESFNQRELVKKLDNILEMFKDIQLSVAQACSRLEDIRNSYTLYRDLVIVDQKGIVIANSNVQRRDAVLGLDLSKEDWFIKALQTKDGTEYHVQDIAPSKVEDGMESLVYGTAIRENGDEQGKVIGAMGVYFDFQGESQLILNEYMPTHDGELVDGWFSFFTNKAGRVICSNDELAIPSGSYANIPRKHCNLQQAGEFCVSTTIMRGAKSLIVSNKSGGFDDYKGLGWTSHFIFPESAMFDRAEQKEDFGISSQELMSSHLIPEINKQTYKEIQRNKGDIQLISINGIVLATDLGKAGSSFIPIFDQITSTGNSTTGKMEELLAEMSSDMLQQNLKALENFSKQAIDLIDRNLFERAADVRWWASDHAFWNALENPTPDLLNTAAKRLSIINASYTMYRDLVIADLSGKIVASSKSENRDRLNRSNVSDQYWYRQGTQSNSSSNYYVQDAAKNNLENEDISLIYSSGILEKGQRTGKSLGALGIFFDWEAIAVPILLGSLPRINGEVVSGVAAFYVNKNNFIIASTDNENFPKGQKVELPTGKHSLTPGASSSGIFQLKDTRYIIGSSRTKGYREYQGLGWSAHVVRPID